MKKIFFYSLLFLLKQSSLIAQQRYNFVISSITGERLPYASILWGKANGLSCNEQGICSFTSITKIDSFVFSNVGYKDSLQLSANFKPINDTIYIQLQALSKKLPDAIVIANGKLIEAGTIATKANSYILNNTPKHLITALRVESQKEISKIISLSVFIARGSTIELPLRIRIYNSNNNLPFEDILIDNVVLKDYKVNAWNEIFLEDSNLFLRKGIYFIGIEWLCTEQTKQNGLRVGILMSKQQIQQTFYQHSNRKWVKDTVTVDGESENIMLKIKLLQ
ncbi:MAG: hypothetical protein JSR12_10865 [Bacteroidetes bacterium]|nr:hypothetical protein [Bacteroidota bacterium]MBS1643364.1 hypothetical protein [Bacteroidota bacterium]